MPLSILYEGISCKILDCVGLDIWEWLSKKKAGTVATYKVKPQSIDFVVNQKGFMLAQGALQSSLLVCCYSPNCHNKPDPIIILSHYFKVLCDLSCSARLPTVRNDGSQLKLTQSETDKNC